MDTNYLLQQIINGIITGSMYCLMAIGLSLIWSILGVLNFTHGTFYMIGAYIAYFILEIFEFNIITTLLITIIIVFILGILIERITIYPLLKYQGTQEWGIGTVITTLGATFFLQYLALILFGSKYRSIEPFSQGVLHVLNCSVSKQMGVNFIISILLIFSVLIFLRYTKVGLAMQAISQNSEGAALLGINDKKIFTFTFAISVSLVGAAGVLLSPIYNIYPFVGWAAFFKAFVIVIIGGLGSVEGAIIAAMLLGLTESIVVMFLPSGWVDVFIFFVVIILLVFRPKGLLGKKEE